MFENTYFFFLFFLVPLVVLFFIFDILQTRKKAKIIAGEKTNFIIPYYSEGQKWLKLVFYTLGLCLFILVLARPRFGVETIDAKVTGRDILILLDVSYSMATSDVIPSRLEAAKRGINEILEMEQGDRVGLMVFSEEAELLSPVTNDYGAIGFFLDSVYPNMLPKDGTNIGNAIMEGIKAFEDNEPRNKMILLVTDGENLTGDYYSMLQKVKETEIKVFTIGVGTKNGEPIPVRNSKGEIESYLKDDAGKHVISKLDEKRLLEIASTTSGSYLRSTGVKGEYKNFINSINSVEKKSQKSLNYSQKKEQYPIFLIPALILFCLGFILDQGRLIKVNTDKFNWLFNKNLLILLCLLAFSTVNVVAKQDVSTDKNVKDKTNWIGDPNGGFWGNMSFKGGNYKKALEQYTSALNSPTSPKENDLGKLYYNLGVSYYKLNDLKKAAESFENASLFLNDGKIKSQAYYNQGLVAFKNRDYKTSKEMFKKSILLNPEDDDARYNYEIVKKLEEKQKNDQQQQQKQQKQQNQNQQEQKQDKKDQNELSKEDLQKILNALSEKEKKENQEQSLQKQKNSNNDRVKSW